jgi:hypothetical protein
LQSGEKGAEGSKPGLSDKAIAVGSVHFQHDWKSPKAGPEKRGKCQRVGPDVHRIGRGDRAEPELELGLQVMPEKVQTPVAPGPVCLDLLQRDRPPPVAQPGNDFVDMGMAGLSLHGLLEAEVDQSPGPGVRRYGAALKGYLERLGGNHGNPGIGRRS